MRSKQRERRPKRPLGPMQLERTVQALPSHQRLLMRFNFVSDLNIEALPCFLWLKQQPEIRKLMTTAKATRKNDVTQDCRQLEAALLQCSDQELARLKLSWLVHSAMY